ncbi:DUF481 domain-containing protein [Pseudomonadota bacterium]
MADQLILANGDRMTGAMVRVEDGTVVFKTAYAGEIKIELKHVATIRTDEPMHIRARDETAYSTNEVALKGDALIVTSSGGGPVIELDKSNLYMMRPESEVIYTGWRKSGRVNFAFNFNRGNSDTDIMGADIDIRFRKPLDRIRLTGQWDRQRAQGVDFVKRRFIDGNYNHFISETWYAGAALRAERDEFANLSDRIITGPLVGHQFYESEPLNLLLELGLMYVYEDFVSEPVNKYWGPSWHLLFDKYILGVSGLQFYHEQAGLVNVENTSKWLWDSWTGLRMPLYGGILVSAEVQVGYDSEPAPDTETTNTVYRLKLGYQW